MKSMMKKTLSVIIALAMILVPMSVFAAAGDPVAMPENFIWSGSIVTVEAGATTYFELGGSVGTFEFIVEGTGDFTVAVCTEGDGTEPYAEGTPVASVDGVVTTQLGIFESTYGCGAFAITNNSAEAVDYTCTVIYPEGSQDNPKALTLAVGDTATVTVPAGSQYYIAATLPVMGMEYQLTITGNTGFGFTNGMGMPMWDTNGTYTGTIAAFWGAANFAIVNNTAEDQTYTLALADIPKPLGSEFNPDELPMDTTTTKTLEGDEYWYAWTATEDGTFTFTYENDLCVDGWTYYIEHGEDVYFYSTAWDEYEYVSCSFDVVAGDEVKVSVSIPTYFPATEYYEAYYDAYVYNYGDVVFTTAFTTGDDNQGGDDIGGGDEGGDDVNYVESGEFLVVGDNMVVVDGGYEYTIYTFEPTEEGEYTFTSDNAVMGIVSYNGMWLSVDPSADTVNANEFSWECTGVGQAIWVAVKADTNIANINITREDLDTSDDIVWIDYENMTTPEDFTFDEEGDTIVLVDVEDDVDDSEYLFYNEEDGYYHYGAEDGPIVYVNLDDSMMSMVAVVSNGKLVGANNEECTELVNCTDAIMEYIACADTVTAYDEDGEEVSLSLYPLTDDLIVMYIACGDYMGWYGEEGWLELDTPDAWMFACCYVPATADEGGDDNTGDDNTGNVGDDNTGNVGGNTGSGTVADPEIPNTNAEAFGVAFAMMATAAALGATAIVTKKSKRVK